MSLAIFIRNCSHGIRRKTTQGRRCFDFPSNLRSLLLDQHTRRYLSYVYQMVRNFLLKNLYQSLLFFSFFLCRKANIEKRCRKATTERVSFSQTRESNRFQVLSTFLFPLRCRRRESIAFTISLFVAVNVTLLLNDVDTDTTVTVNFVEAIFTREV